MWKNAATPRSIRLQNQIGEIHHEIMQNYLPVRRETFIIDTENTRTGKRIKIWYANTKELLEEFPDLKGSEYEALLYAYEKLKEERNRQQDIEEIANELGY